MSDAGTPIVPAPVAPPESSTDRPPGAGGDKPTALRPRRRRLPARDRAVVIAMIAIPTVFVIGLVWLPAIASVLLSFTSYNGIGGFDTIEVIGVENYRNVFTNYPPFWPAIQHNIIWLAFLFLGPTLLGIFIAVLLDKELRGSRIYQTALYMPVVLSLALVGFIWQLIYSRDQGLLNGVLGTDVDWYGDPKVNLWAVLVATAWQHTGYIMLLYLAGLKGVDGSLREAAAVDGSGEVSTFFRIIVPVMRPINLIIIVVVVIQSLRAFDLVWIVNKGRNGLEIIAALVTSNVVGEASRIGFGSAMATIMLLISSVFIAIYLRVVMKEDQ
jgi:multiple sugar transport system permease protein